MNGLDLSKEEYEETFEEFQTTAVRLGGPIKTIENWNNGRSKEERKAFLKGMIFNFFLQKTGKSIQEEMKNSMFR